MTHLIDQKLLDAIRAMKDALQEDEVQGPYMVTVDGEFWYTVDERGEITEVARKCPYEEL